MDDITRAVRELDELVAKPDVIKAIEYLQMKAALDREKERRELLKPIYKELNTATQQVVEVYTLGDKYQIAKV